MLARWSTVGRADARRPRRGLGLADATLAELALVWVHALRATSRRLDVDDRSGLLGTTTPRLGSRAQTEPRYIVTYWISDVLAILVAGLSHPPLREFLRPLRFLVDDTRSGCVSGRLLQRLGGSAITLAPPGHPERLQRLREIVADGGSCAFAVDGGGPYREVGTGLIGLATLLDAAIVPVTARVTPAFSVGGPARLQVPLPGYQGALAIGQPIPVSKGIPRSHAAVTVKAALDQLRVEARGALRAPFQGGREAA